MRRLSFILRVRYINESGVFSREFGVGLCVALYLRCSVLKNTGWPRMHTNLHEEYKLNTNWIACGNIINTVGHECTLIGTNNTN